MKRSQVCSKCGAPLPGGTMGNRCPRCLLELALTPSPDDLDETVAVPAALERLRTLPLPCRFGDYELLEEIGRGGMGVVYKARQLSLNRVLALKLMLSGQFASGDAMRRFHREAETEAALRHPNIVTLYEFGEWEGHCFFSMEYVEGQSLAVMASAGPLPAQQAARYVMLVAEAIHYAHSHGVLHRDLKPSNVLVDMDDQPRITDFGLAKRLHPPPGLRHFDVGADETLSGQPLGSPHYMPPEQAVGHQGQIGPRSDIYALGGILFHLLTGRPPFVGETLTALLRQVQDAEPVRPRLLNPNVSRDLETICLKCLEKDPERRFGSAREMADELGRLPRGEPILTHPLAWLSRLWRWCRRKPRLAALAATVVLLAGIVAFGAPVAWIGIRRERDAALRHAVEEVKQRRLADTALYQLNVERAREMFANANASGGLAVLASLLRRNPADRAVAEWLMNEMTYRSFALPTTEPMRHDDMVFTVEFSSDGRKLLTVSRDNSARVWDATTGQPLAPPLLHDASRVRSGEFFGWPHPLFAQLSPDGQRVVTASLDGTAQVWDAATGKPLLTTPLKHPAWVVCARFSPDGNRVATSCADGLVRVWDARSGDPAGPILAHAAPVTWVEFRPDGQRLVTASHDGSGQVWDVATGHAVGQPLRHSKWVRTAVFNPDGTAIATTSADYTARIWDAATGEPITPLLQHEAVVNTAEFSPDGLWLITSSWDSTARVWESATGRLVGLPLKHGGIVRSASFSPDGQRIVTSSEDGTARLWDRRTGQPLTEPFRHRGTVWSAQFSPDGQKVATASSDGAVQVWDVRQGQALPRKLGTGSKVERIQWSPEGQWVMPSCVGAKAWDLAIWPSRIETGLHHNTPSVFAQLSPDGRRLVTVAEDGTALIWDARQCTALSRKLRHDAAIKDARFSPDGSLLVTASADRTARVWDAFTGEPLHQLLRHDDVVYEARFSPDSRHVVTACADKTARLWDFRAGQLTIPPILHSGEVVSAQFSPDGQSVLTVSKDDTARVWEARSGKPLADPMKHDEPLSSARFSEDGRYVVTASRDRTARLWESRSGAPAGQPMKHDAAVNAAVLSHDGTRAATACENGSVRVWDPHTAHPLSGPIKLGQRAHCVEFSPNDQWIAAGTERAAYIVEILRAPLPIPEGLAGFAEAVAGQRLNAQGSPEFVPPGELVTSTKVFGDDRAADPFRRWAGWYTADRSTRAISPSARATVADWINHLAISSRWLNDVWLLAELRETLGFRPDDPALAGALARLIIAAPDPSNPHALVEAGWWSARATTLAPEFGPSWWARAAYLERAGDLPAALQAIERAANLAPRDAYLWRMWIRLLEKANRVQEASVILGRALELSEQGAIDGDDILRVEKVRLLQRQMQATEAHAAWLQVKSIAERDPTTPSWLLDLTPFFNASLDQSWAYPLPSRRDLVALPRGRQTFAGVDWDIRGLIQLSSPRLLALHLEYAAKIEGIPVRQRCRRLHFLHAADVATADGTRLGGYIIHYADGGQQEIPIVYGQDLVAWDLDPPRTNSPPVVAWAGRNRVSVCVQLFKTTWDNPRPDDEITSLDLVSAMAPAAPFVVAITAEP
ncbi:MAG: protein kinase [Verrucomicrobiia bacterium]